MIFTKSKPFTKAEIEKLAFFRGNCNINSQEKNSNHQEGIRGIYGVKKILNIHNCFFCSVKIREIANPNIANGKLAVNNRWYCSGEETPNKPGATNKTPNHAEVKLTNIKVVTSKNVSLENNLINYQFSKALYLCQRILML